MSFENEIEIIYRDLLSITNINKEYFELYNSIKNKKIVELLSTIHYELINLFRCMNTRLPTSDFTAHYWANESRKLISTINITFNLKATLNNSEYAFSIDEYYLQIMEKCRDFLKSSGGSEIPENMDIIKLYYKDKIFLFNTKLNKKVKEETFNYNLKNLGNGSYANVFKYKDDFYNKYFVLKRAKKDLNQKELERFKLEFIEMKKLNSPYIVEVYSYFDSNNEYIMEYMDDTLDQYIKKNNNKLDNKKRKLLVNQIIRAFEYIHSKNYLHRDISPKNILIKKYDDTIIVKISDFGLVKIPESKLTSINTQIKGYFNDPFLQEEGFDKYNILHETYAVTKIIFFVMTGKERFTKTDNIKLNEFYEKGVNKLKENRFKNIKELKENFNSIKFNN